MCLNMRYLFLQFFQYYALVTVIATASVLPKRNINYLRTGLNMHKFAQSYSPLEIKRERISVTSYENMPLRRALQTLDLENLFDKNCVIYLGSLTNTVPELDGSEDQGSSREIQDFKELFDKNGIILYLPSPKIVPAFKMSKKPRLEAYGENLHDIINNFKDKNEYWHKDLDKSKTNTDINYLFKHNNDKDRTNKENNAIAKLLKALRFDKRQPKAMFEFSKLVA